MQPFIDHIQITVKNMEQAEPFYDKFLAIIGFDISKKLAQLYKNMIYMLLSI